MLDITTYRIKTDRWRRTWQAEWTGCQRAPRAWTERGVIRKAIRWSGRSNDLRDGSAIADGDGATAGVHVWPPSSSDPGRQPQTAIPQIETPERGE